jgi:hypothetical protein
MSEDYKELEVLFPSKKIPLAKGHDITIRPLSLEDLPKAAEAFSVLMGLVSTGKTVTEIATLAISEVLKLSKYCLDIPPKYIPIDKVPDILSVMLEQNMSEDIVKKWKTLTDLIKAELGQGGEEKKEKPSHK